MCSRLRAVRKALHLSQREFGERLGVSRDVISNMEYGRVQPKELFLQHLCRLYKVNRAWLDSGEGPIFAERSENDKFIEFSAVFKALRPEFQDYALAQMKQMLKLQEKLRLQESSDPVSAC